MAAPTRWIKSLPLPKISTVIEACQRSGRWTPNWWVFPWCWKPCTRKIFAKCLNRLCPRPLRWRVWLPAPLWKAWSGMSWPPGGIVPLWWHWRACSPPGSLARCNWRTPQRLSANVDDLLLSLSSRNSLLYGFENMIAKQKWKVKLETNEHFRKFLSDFFVL